MLAKFWDRFLFNFKKCWTISEKLEDFQERWKILKWLKNLWKILPKFKANVEEMRIIAEVFRRVKKNFQKKLYDVLGCVWMNFIEIASVWEW